MKEAEAMAVRRGTKLSMIREFFGEDFSGLTRDVQLRKAKDFLYGQLMIK